MNGKTLEIILDLIENMHDEIDYTTELVNEVKHSSIQNNFLNGRIAGLEKSLHMLELSVSKIS